MPPDGNSRTAQHARTRVLSHQADRTDGACSNLIRVHSTFSHCSFSQSGLTACLFPIALSRPARIAISGSFFLFALAGYYYEPYVLPIPDHQRTNYDASGGRVLVDAREGERVPVRLSVVDRSATRGV